jgi:CDP-2,3-bis-(O-geranylgeranyl)-sn-glycerol synthase
MLELLKLIAKTIWLLLPAYTPNNFAVVFGGGTPIDFGKNFIDGKRILGNGKTYRGFFAGVAGGLLVAHIEFGIETLFGFSLFTSLPYYKFFILSLALSAGSLIGDCLGSFIKRRFGVERGANFPLLDQYDFLTVSLFLSWIICTDAFKILYTPSVLISGVLITPVLHKLTNVIAYKLGLKDVPW